MSFRNSRIIDLPGHSHTHESTLLMHRLIDYFYFKFHSQVESAAASILDIVIKLRSQDLDIIGPGQR
jgi:hypothetical protein